MSLKSITNIDNTDIIIHINNKILPLTNFEEDEYFGILKTKISKTKLIKTPTFLLFTIDKTSSMSESASGRSTKMNHVIQTFVNMMKYLSTLDTEIYIQVNTFNTEVEILVECLRITHENVEAIINKIKNITTYGSTNIGEALQFANETLTNYEKENESHQIAHIFMTDGDPTSGETSHKALADMINEKFYNIFVGFGFNHNVTLLSMLGDKKNSEYQFVDNIENTSLIYGETIHRFIYPALKDVELRIENGLIYDWQTNTWTTKITESIIIGEIEKVHHIKTKDPIGVSVSIFGRIASMPYDFNTNEQGNDIDLNNKIHLLETATIIPYLIDMETNNIISDDLTKYAFRQKVQELLFEARNYSSSKRGEKENYKKSLKNVFRIIRKYMRINNLEDDGLLNMLCDDIHIMYRTVGSHYGELYAVSRHTSQGRQRTYNTNSLKSNGVEDDFDNLISRKFPQTPKLSRSMSIPHHITDPFNIKDSADIINDDPFYKYKESGLFVPPDNNSKDQIKDIYHDSDFIKEDEIDCYLSLDQITTCFATPDILNTLKFMSQPSK
jgi:uncharacterized protein YegL